MSAVREVAPTASRGRPRAALRPRRDERGQTALLVIGFLVVVAMTVVVVVDASAAYLRRQALNTLADGAALAAVDGVREDQVYGDGLGSAVVVDPRAAAQRVNAYFRSVGAGTRYPGLRHSVRAEADRVVVRVVAPLDLPFAVPGVASRTEVTATAAAVASVGE